ncbi:hypothetical protein FHL15_007851 [Xylaria flabelliformis]|uniref:ER-bound oxygenase mpaB/mpaB'/Rubber oxygenase catalytic domain-containing protein n=1 Tax=Xylaria flabelliformis TaxID=2512241 RepID=A0A553HTG8_9PEZI|nr:hypothetical protein FHL15_007851 [Xylaria flabelliformis]
MHKTFCRHSVFIPKTSPTGTSEILLNGLLTSRIVMSSHPGRSPLWGPESGYSRSWFFWIIASLLVYVPLCVIVRRHQMRRMARRHVSRENMTLEEAYAIKCRLAEHEFPTVFSAAINSVFFKAESIPTIAKLIARAMQRSSPERKPRGPSVTPLDLLGRPGAPATIAAVDRVNRIHALYRPSGVMSDTDLLYVLSLFALEPERWMKRFEWRSLTTRERCAFATLWKALGEDLHIPFDALLPSGKEGFRDALHWLQELEQWARDYEAKNRKKSPESVFLGEKQLDARTKNVPRPLKRVARGFAAALIEPELRQAMGTIRRIETPPAATIFIVESIIRVRKFTALDLN